MNGHFGPYSSYKKKNFKIPSSQKPEALTLEECMTIVNTPLRRRVQAKEEFRKTTKKKEMKRVFLIGYMGAGKTTLGKALSKKSGLTFIDLDWYIEERYHKTIQQIFADHGEEGFREIEKNMLHEVSEFEDVIISTGGGTPCFFDNMDYMNSVGETVFWTFL